ncbi:hypothetical protein UNSWDHB_611 [Dehalobacter sp. UNSWDHB]|nr:hypothetical protein DHBDCA_p1927 [Dehalobacter sp. DCA]AFV05940.1 hypothetical protein DCF50_p1938 [Dehalobacter sp. CF]EQB22074.1 hypothetical protein UNSWDHB_611 [Dehalobacter sp. UNSWDHB]
MRGLVWLTAIWGIEYFSGLFLLKILGVYPWRYTDPLAINGLITLSYAPVWFIGGLLFERVHRKLDAFVILTNRYSER